MLRVTMVALCALVLLLTSMAQGAAVPQKINYQAVLLDDVGDPVTDPVNLTFSIYDVDVGGTPLWTQTMNGVQPDANGQFSVILGDDMDPISHEVLTGGQLWLGILVEGDAEEMSPRTELVSSAYSFRVNTVDQAEAGTIYGPLTIEESLSKLADAQVIVTCAAKAPETVEISPCDGVILKATNQTGDEVLLAEVDDVDQDALLTLTDPTTDALAAYGATAAEFGTSVAKALQKKYVYGVAGFQHFDDNGTDILGEWGQMAPGQTYIGMTDYSAKAAGASLKIRPPSVDLADVFTVKTSTGDPTFNLQSDPDEGAKMSFYTPNLARASAEKTRIGNLGLSFFGADETEELLKVEEETPGVVSITGTDYSAKAAGASVQIKAPRTGFPEAFTIANSNGDATFQIESDPADSAASISIYSTAAAKDSRRRRRVLFNGDGFFVFGATESETAAVITTAGDIGMLELNKRSGEPVDERRVRFEPNGVYFLNATKQETTMIIYADGSIKGIGQIAMGQNVSNDGNFSNVLGFGNVASGDSASVLGGYDNTASGYCSVVAGGRDNLASGLYSFVAGRSCTSSVAWSTVGGGGYNSARNDFATVGGGRHNYADGNESTIAGGHYNYAHGYYSAIGGGQSCTTYTTCATVPGGRMNSAKGHYSFAAGNRAKVLTDHHGTFVWADQTDADFASTDVDQFLVRATNGVGINVNDPTEDLDVAGTARLRGLPSTVSFTYPYVVRGSGGKLYTRDDKSSRRYKKDIRELGIDGDKILQMEPVRFAWKENDMEDVGLIAEEVAKLIPELVIYDQENRPDGVRYDKVVLYLLAALKEMKAENDALKAHQTSTDARLSQLTELVEILLAKQNDSKSGDNKWAINR